jgi:TPR repeat protein
MIGNALNRLTLTAALTAASSLCLAQSAGLDPALLARANSGDGPAQVQVGDAYADGNGVAKDYKQAAEWFRKAADKGDISGLLHLASLYRDGKGVARDMTQAATLYRQAAELDDPTAQGTLGLLYSMGQGVPHNDVEAYYWLDLAASSKGPRQEAYAANRQMIGTHITADELAAVQERVANWIAAHRKPDAPK